MTYFKTLALLTLLTLNGAAFAVDSTPTDHNNAGISLSASGTASQNVSFSVPSATVTIDTNFVRPGSSFNVSIPVTNTTDRTITVTGQEPVISGSLPSGILSITAQTSTAQIPTGGDASLVYTFTFAPLAAGDEAISGKIVTVQFDLTATSDYDAPTDTTF